MSSFRQQNYLLASDILNALNEAKSSVSEEDIETTPYWRIPNGAITITFKFSRNGKDIRDSKNSAIVASWSSVYVTLGEHINVPLKFTTGKNNEICLGKIGLPENSKAFEELRDINPEARARMSVHKISINANKYKNKSNLVESSVLYDLVELLSQIFEKEITNYLGNGSTFIDFIKKSKTATKTLTALDVLKAYDLENPNVRLGGQILLTDDSKSSLKKSFPDAKDIATLFDKLFIVPYTKISSCIQSNVPENAKTNGGAALPNPYVRCLIECNQITGLPKTPIWDFEQGKVTKTNVPVLVNNHPINVNNIHEAIPYGTEFRGKFNYSEICFSKVAISLPLKVDELVIMKSNFVQSEAKSSWYDDDSDEDNNNGKVAATGNEEPKEEPKEESLASAASTTSAASSASEEEEEEEDLF